MKVDLDDFAEALQATNTVNVSDLNLKNDATKSGRKVIRKLLSDLSKHRDGIKGHAHAMLLASADVIRSQISDHSSNEEDNYIDDDDAIPCGGTPAAFLAVLLSIVMKYTNVDENNRSMSDGGGFNGDNDGNVDGDGDGDEEAVDELNTAMFLISNIIGDVSKKLLKKNGNEFCQHFMKLMRVRHKNSTTLRFVSPNEHVYSFVNLFFFIIHFFLHYLLCSLLVILSLTLAEHPHRHTSPMRIDLTFIFILISIIFNNTAIIAVRSVDTANSLLSTYSHAALSTRVRSPPKSATRSVQCVQCVCVCARW